MRLRSGGKSGYWHDRSTQRLQFSWILIEQEPEETKPVVTPAAAAERPASGNCGRSGGQRASRRLTRSASRPAADSEVWLSITCHTVRDGFSLQLQFLMFHSRCGTAGCCVTFHLLDDSARLISSDLQFDMTRPSKTLTSDNPLICRSCRKQRQAWRRRAGSWRQRRSLPPPPPLRWRKRVRTPWWRNAIALRRWLAPSRRNTSPAQVRSCFQLNWRCTLNIMKNRHS